MTIKNFLIKPFNKILSKIFIHVLTLENVNLKMNMKNKYKMNGKIKKYKD